MGAIVILGITVIIGWAILHRSSQKSEKAYWAEHTSKECSEYGVDNSQSLGAIVGAIALAAAVVFIAVKCGVFPQ